MARKVNKHRPTDGEMDILQALWIRGEGTIREICEEMKLGTRTEYNAIQTRVGILVKKGMVRRDDRRPLHVFYPAVTPEKVQRSVLKDLLRRLFRGDSKQLVMQALASTKAPKDVVADIDRRFEQMDRKGKKE